MINDSSLTPSQTAQARHHTYTLISQLYLNGITGDLTASFYVELAKLTLDLVHDHYSDLSHDLTLASELVKKTLPAAPSVSSFLDLEDEQSKLKKIGSYFVTPPYSGIYVSRHDIALLGRQNRLPRGFGGRKQLFNNLLRVASQYDEVLASLYATARGKMAC